jgi:hypothetical protein
MSVQAAKALDVFICQTCQQRKERVRAAIVAPPLPTPLPQLLPDRGKKRRPDNGSDSDRTGARKARALPSPPTCARMRA